MSASDIVTRERFEAALEDFHKADTIEKTAKALREQARKTILEYWRINMDEFQPAGEDGKTFVHPGREEVGKGVSITQPAPTGALPSRLDPDRVDEAYWALSDLDPVSADTLFPKGPRAFAGPERVVEWCREHPECATTIAGVLVKFTLPATEGTPSSPRVSPVKRKAKG